MSYEHNGKRTTVTRVVTTVDAPYVVQFAGRDIRRERSGVHARIDISINGVTLAYSTFNIERDEDRVRLSNSAYKQYSKNGLAKEYPAEFLKKDLDLFCDGLWDDQLAVTLPAPMAGSTDRTPPAFLLKPYILKDAGTLVFAPPGQGKSFTLLLMAVSLDAGLDTLWPCEPTKVLFVNLERSARSVADRLGNVNAALGLSRARPLDTLNARGKGLLDVIESIERWVEQQDIGCVLLDSISRAGMGDLNENQSANKIIDALNGLGIAWLALAHTPRGDPSHIYGSMHFEAGADINVKLLSQLDEGKPLGIALSITQANDIAHYPPHLLALGFDEAGLTSVRPGGKGEFPELEDGKPPSLGREVEDYVLSVGASTATQIGRAIGRPRSKISTLLAGSPAYRVIRRQGAEVYYGHV